jgi:ribosome recycling factor
MVNLTLLFALQVDALTEKKVKAVDAEVKAKEKDIMS